MFPFNLAAYHRTVVIFRAHIYLGVIKDIAIQFVYQDILQTSLPHFTNRNSLTIKLPVNLYSVLFSLFYYLYHAFSHLAMVEIHVTSKAVGLWLLKRLSDNCI